MATPMTTDANTRKVGQLEHALAEILAQTLRQGFFGTAALEVRIQDGTIQHILRRIEQVER